MSTFSPAGHSYRDFVGKTVLCKLREAASKEEYYFEGLAEVTEFSNDGRPMKFGNYVSNRAHGCWEPPTETDQIHDERKSQ